MKAERILELAEKFPKMKENANYKNAVAICERCGGWTDDKRSLDIYKEVVEDGKTFINCVVCIDEMKEADLYEQINGMDADKFWNSETI